jgi:hypothetical protein
LISVFNSCAAWGEKLKETEPSTRFSVRGTEDISYLLKIIRNYPYYQNMLPDTQPLKEVENLFLQ